MYNPIMKTQTNPSPLVGVGVMVLKDDKVLLSKRKGSHGDGEYAFPGGHLEFGESFENCARREVMEETGIKIKNIRFNRLANTISYKGKHYVDVSLIADYDSGVVELKEPSKAESWGWYSLDRLPKPLFQFCQTAFDSLKSGKIYYDSK